jgi:hypothetical protein
MALNKQENNFFMNGTGKTDRGGLKPSSLAKQSTAASKTLENEILEEINQEDPESLEACKAAIKESQVSPEDQEGELEEDPDECDS